MLLIVNVDVTGCLSTEKKLRGDRHINVIEGTVDPLVTHLENNLYRR